MIGLSRASRSACWSPGSCRRASDASSPLMAAGRCWRSARVLLAAGLAGARPRAKLSAAISRPGPSSAPAWARGSMTRRSRRSGNIYGSQRARRDHVGDAVRRVRQHGLLAAQRVPGAAVRLARSLLHLCGDPDRWYRCRSTVLRCRAAGTRTRAQPKPAAVPSRLQPGERAVFAILAAVITIGAAILAIVGTHLLPLLQARGAGPRRSRSGSARSSDRRKSAPAWSRCSPGVTIIRCGP